MLNLLTHHLIYDKINVYTHHYQRYEPHNNHEYSVKIINFQLKISIRNNLNFTYLHDVAS